jgi:DNA processing protein
VAQPPSLPWIALSLLPANPRTLQKALDSRRGDPESALRALGAQPTEALAAARDLLPRLARDGIQVVCRHEPGYPSLLAQIHDPPPALYFRGDLQATDDPLVAVVGSRRASPYGLAVARVLARDLAAAGVTVVSGLARGIDAAAHGGALAATRGRAVAVLGSGLDVIYPPEHRRLAAAVMSRGALVSEFPPGTPPLARNFPRRNRVISGLARGTVVVEAAAGSGSLITARLALDQGREVYAVPGPITSGGSLGTHQLLKEGARLTTSAADVVAEFPADVLARVIEGLAARDNGPPPGLDPNALEVWKALKFADPITIDDLAGETCLAVPALVAALLGLELRGLARALPGPRYIRGGGQKGALSYIDTPPGRERTP